MPVEAQTVEYSYLGDGVSTVFGFPSRFLSNDDLFVALNGVIQVAGFTITGAGTDDGGEVTFTVPPGNLVRVMLVRNPSPSQLVDFENGQTVLEGTLDNALDKLTMIAQYLLRSARRSVRIGDAIYTTEGAGLLELPKASDRVAKLFAFDNDGKVELIDRAAFEQAMADAVAAAATAVAAAAEAEASEGSAESSALAAAQALSDIQLLLNGVSSATRRKFIMTEGQTVITVGPFTTNALFVYYDGVLLDPVGEYTTASPIITLTAGAAAGAQIDVIEFKAVNVTNALIAANDLADVSNKKNGRQNLEITKVMTGPNAAASISADSRVVHVSTALTAPRVYTLPAANAVNPGEAVEVFDTAGGVTSTNTLTIQRAGADTINGGTTAVLTTPRSAIRLVSDGVSKWSYAQAAVGASPGEVKDFAGPKKPPLHDWADGGAISRATFALAFEALTVVVTGTLTNGNATISAVSEDLTGLGLEGAIVEGTAGSVSGLTINSITSTTVVLSGNAAASGAVTLRILPHGRGDGATTFNKPDRRGRAAIGRDNMGGTAANRVTNTGTGNPGLNAARLGAAGGADRYALTTAELAAHNHGITDPGHAHTYAGGGNAAGSGTAAAAGQSANAYLLGNMTAATTGITIQNNGSGNAHQNVQPSITTNHVVFLGA